MVSLERTGWGGANKLTLLGLGHIPLHDVGLGDPDILGQLDGTIAATAQLEMISTRKNRRGGSPLTAPMTRTLGRRPAAFLPVSSVSLTESISRLWLA